MSAMDKLTILYYNTINIKSERSLVVFEVISVYYCSVFAGLCVTITPVMLVNPSGYLSVEVLAQYPELRNIYGTSGTIRIPYKQYYEPQPVSVIEEPKKESLLPEKWQERNKTRIETLVEELQPLATELIEKANEIGIALVVTSTYRSFQE